MIPLADVACSRCVRPVFEEVEEEAVGLEDAAANRLLQAGCGDGQSKSTLLSTRYYQTCDWLIR